MTRRIFLSIMTAAGVALLAALLLILGVIQSAFTQRYRQQFRDEAAYAAAGLETGGVEFLRSLSSASSRITLIDRDGTVLYDSAGTEHAENHSQRQEVQQALENGSGESSRYSATLSERTYNYALRLEDGRVLRISAGDFTMISVLRTLAKPLILIVVTVVLLSLFLASKLTRSIVRPINQMDPEHPDKAKIYTELTPLLDRLSSQSGQIDEQIRELRRKQQEFAAITENMQEGFLILDRDTNVLSYNTSALRLLGADDAVLGQSVLKLNASRSFRHAVERSIAGEHYERTMNHDDCHYHLIANPVHQEEEIIGAVLIILDVTEKDQRENLRREFTANVSHELKTPLTSISGFAEIILSGLAKPEDITHFASNIYAEAQRLITLVGDIIKLSQMDENSIPVGKEPVDLREIADSVRERLAHEAAKKHITLAVHGSHETVSGVPQILDEMVLNLCDNAIKYNVEGGRVDITVSRDPRGAVFLSVADTGIGIPQSDRERVFERFYRVDKSHSKEIGGTGLGLSIVKHGAAYHGATLALESELDKGTTITMTF